MPTEDKSSDWTGQLKRRSHIIIHGTAIHQKTVKIKLIHMCVCSMIDCCLSSSGKYFMLIQDEGILMNDDDEPERLTNETLGMCNHSTLLDTIIC